MSLGYKQVQGVDYEEMHSPVISDVGFRMILNVCIQNDWRIVKLDVEEAFLLGKLEEETYVEIPDGFDEKGSIGKLNSAIYGLCQASRVFYKTMRDYLTKELGFKICVSDGCILMKKGMILGLYVDDILVTGEFDVVEKFVKEFMSKFKSRYYEEVKDFIGCELNWDLDNKSVLLHQTTMIKKLEVKMKPYLEKYNIKCNSIPMEKGTGIRKLGENEEFLDGELQSTYRSCVGSLLYITKHSRPDL